MGQKQKLSHARMLYIHFIMFYKFSQIRTNDGRKFSQLQVTFCVKLECFTIQEKHHLIYFRLESQQN